MKQLTSAQIRQMWLDLISGNQKVMLLNHQLTWFQLTTQLFFGLTQGLPL